MYPYISDKKKPFMQVLINNIIIMQWCLLPEDFVDYTEPLN